MIVDGYVRVSQVGNRRGASFISPSLQRERIERWCALHNATVGEMHEELDQSGANPNRPLLQRALTRIEGGETAGVVVARMDRFGRSLLDSLAAIERIDRAGGVFVSVDDGLDLTTNTGRLVLRIMLSLAEYDLDRIRETWRDSARKAIARGVHICPHPPWGYQRGPEGRLALDPKAAAYVKEIFVRRGEGDGLLGLCRWLESEGVLTAAGNPGWTNGVLSVILRNRVYLGEAHRGDLVNPDAHPAIVDAPTFHRAQHPRHEWLGAQRRGDLLTGFVRCASCRMKLYGRTNRNDRHSYACKVYNAAGACPHPAHVDRNRLDAFVVDGLLERLRAESRGPQSRRAEQLRERLERAEAAVSRYRDNTRLEATLGTDRYIEGLRKRVAAVESAALAVAGHRTPRREPVTRDEWDSTDPETKRRLIGIHIDAVFIAHGQLPVPDRAFICWHGEAPNDLPRRGRHKATILAFDPDACAPSAARRRRPRAFQRRLPVDELERRLRDLCRYDERFPERTTFCVRGQRELYEEMGLQGGRAHWAAVIGLPTRSGVKRRKDAEVLRDLREYLDGRTSMPRFVDFRADGQVNFWHLLNRRGGIDHWCELAGIEPPDRPRRAS